MTAISDVIAIKLAEYDAAIKSRNGPALEALLFAKKGCNDGNGGKARKANNSPKRAQRDNKEGNNRKEKDLWKCFHCQR